VEQNRPDTRGAPRWGAPRACVVQVLALGIVSTRGTQKNGTPRVVGQLWCAKKW
jgi:hypothetical protein